MKNIENNTRVKKSFNTVIDDVGQNAKYAFIEEYRKIRTNLILALNDIECKKIIVTSASSKEGKTASVINLAITLALAEKRVLIIDCGLNKPLIHEFLQLKNGPGLSEILLKITDRLEGIQETKYPLLKVISAGKIISNHAELIQSTAMADLLNSMETKFDYVIMDTPPINKYSDALALTKVADGVIMIALQGETTHPEFSKALSDLEFAKANILGVIFNRS